MGQVDEVVRADGPTLRARWSLTELLTADGHRLSVVFSASLRILTDPAEQKFFAEAFLNGGSAVSIEQIQQHFQPALRDAAEKLAADEAVERALAKEASGRWIESLRAAADARAFACGIELLAPFSIEMKSPTLALERLQEQQRAAVLRAASERAEHFERAGELMKRWEGLRASSPGLSPGKLLQQMGPGDQGVMLETLLMGASMQGVQPDLLAVTGSSIVRMAVGSESCEPRVMAVTVEAGPLRSIRKSGNGFLIGAQRGVVVVSSDPALKAEVYADPELTSEHGFNSVARNSSGIWGCHREGGLVFWREGKTQRPEWVMRSAQLKGSAKFTVTSADDAGILFAVGARVIRADASASAATVTELASDIVGMFANENRYIVVTEDGQLSVWDGQSWERKSEFRPVNQASAAGILPWLGSVRVLVTSPQGPVHCVGLDDQLVTQYTSAHLSVRGIVGSIGKTAAMSADRQRVILWNSWDGRRPSAELHLTGLTRHRITDLAFA